jgi:hypothetical protein
MDRLEVRGTDTATDRPTPVAWPALRFRSRVVMCAAGREKNPQFIGQNRQLMSFSGNSSKTPFVSSGLGLRSPRFSARRVLVAGERRRRWLGLRRLALQRGDGFLLQQEPGTPVAGPADPAMLLVVSGRLCVTILPTSRLGQPLPGLTELVWGKRRGHRTKG